MGHESRLPSASTSLVLPQPAGPWSSEAPPIDAESAASIRAAICASAPSSGSWVSEGMAQTRRVNGGMALHKSIARTQKCHECAHIRSPFLRSARFLKALLGLWANCERRMSDVN